MIWLYLGTCHEAWAGFGEGWPQRTEFVLKVYALQQNERNVFSWDLNSIFFFSWWPLHQWGFCSVLLLEQQFAKWCWSHLQSYWNNKQVLYWSSRSLRLWLKDTTLYNEGASVSKMQIEIQVKSMWSLLQTIKRLQIQNISVWQLCWWYPDLPSLISKWL